MQLTTLFTLLAGTVASVSAAALVPKDTSPEFNLFVHQPDAEIHGRPLIASKSRLWISPSWTKQDARCRWGQGQPAEGNAAVLFREDDKLFLYGVEEDSQQQLALNPKENGQDNLLYFNTDGGVPNQNLWTEGWTEDDGYLSFLSALFQACPVDNEWNTFRVDIYANATAIDEGCLTFQAKIKIDEDPLPCTYSLE
ncbi:uncharacterized protein C8A04DRAFT_29890 [Dichotomopilus funicola]|uniref:Uncharacterized protein n=1 Tax=Dichotomopilus funicola TaxID=1934379 RepID=A0AAN6V065_9PEZI|nr:hypothetical protein C8A04DRAFT_29890 [Dichotomopilus funicola]